MPEVFYAFVQYLVTFICLVAAAAIGLVCGKKLREKKNLESHAEDTGNTSDR